MDGDGAGVVVGSRTGAPTVMPWPTYPARPEQTSEAARCLNSLFARGRFPRAAQNVRPLVHAYQCALNRGSSATNAVAGLLSFASAGDATTQMARKN